MISVVEIKSQPGQLRNCSGHHAASERLHDLTLTANVNHTGAKGVANTQTNQQQGVLLPVPVLTLSSFQMRRPLKQHTH
jgi:hypothetical protein